MPTTDYNYLIDMISGALEDIDRAESQIGEAHPKDTAAIFAAIAQAKLLAVIAKALAEMKEAQVSQIY